MKYHKNIYLKIKKEWLKIFFQFQDRLRDWDEQNYKWNVSEKSYEGSIEKV